MANNPRAFDTRIREARQRAYEQADTVASRLPQVAELSVDLRFVLESGQPFASPHKWIFLPDMKAYFQLLCPDRDCSDGGFDLEPAIRAAIRSKGRDVSGVLACRGRQRGSNPCGIALHYTIDMRQTDAS